MNIFLIIIFSIIGLFLIIFITGFITAAVRNTGKKRQTASIVAMSQIPKTIQDKLIDIFREYKKEAVVKTNSLVNDLDSSSLDTLLTMANPNNRPAHLSSGKLGDETFQSAMEKKLAEQGYSANARKVIIGIYLHDLDGVLLEMTKNN